MRKTCWYLGDRFFALPGSWVMVLPSISRKVVLRQPGWLEKPTGAYLFGIESGHGKWEFETIKSSEIILNCFKLIVKRYSLKKVIYLYILACHQKIKKGRRDLDGLLITLGAVPLPCFPKVRAHHRPKLQARHTASCRAVIPRKRGSSSPSMVNGGSPGGSK